ncbi:MAG TPA: type II toxin-antitoxin system HigB family toxin [Candidatus Tectomicrobia bacterium]|jgi:mRNA-degrading endonuclease HigB of HigAB toxin-antitoxin module
MRIIKPTRLREYWTQHPQARPLLEQWLRRTKAAHWSSSADLRQTFPGADPVRVTSGRTVVVFNIAGNRYRLLTAIHYNMHAELAHATEIIDMLAGHDLNADQTDYLDVLSTLVEAYENTHGPLDDPALCGLDILRALLAEHGMSAADLARLPGVYRSRDRSC